MNWPMDQPFFQAVYFLVNTAGIGGIAVGLIATFSIVAYALTLRSVVKESDAPEREEYAYPTPTLTHEHEPVSVERRAREWGSSQRFKK